MVPAGEYLFGPVSSPSLENRFRQQTIFAFEDSVNTQHVLVRVAKNLVNEESLQMFVCIWSKLFNGVLVIPLKRFVPNTTHSI
jgi:hypothetical protein